MKIIGAGMAGLLAGKMFQNSKIFELQESLPNNHSALLRFKTNAIAKATGIPFRKVSVRKAVVDQYGELRDKATLRDSNIYSLKVTGKISDRSIIDLSPGERWIAPSDLIARLADNQDIHYNSPAESLSFGDEPTISTIPMPELMRILDYKNDSYPSPGQEPRVIFDFRPIWTANATLKNVDLYQTIYLPYGRNNPYRVTITGNRLTMEFSREITPGEIKTAGRWIDICLFEGKTIPSDCAFTIKRQNFGKIIPIEHEARQQFIMWATDNFNIYSLGRFAVWRPILLDDLVADLQHIANFIWTRNRYVRYQHASNSSQGAEAPWVETATPPKE